MQSLARTNPKRAERDTELALMRLNGATYKDIEKALGISQGRISQLLHDDKQVKAIIEEGAKVQAAMLPTALKAHAECLSSKDEKIKLNAAKLTYNNVGVSPTHTQPQIIANILIQQQSILDPAIMSGLGKYFFDNQGGDMHEFIENAVTD